MLYQRIAVRFPNAKATYLKQHSPLTKVAVAMSTAFIVLLGVQKSAFGSLAADDQVEKQWEMFRRAYPFHLQVIGLTSPLSDQSRVLLISEPPPDIKPDYFKKLAGSVGGMAYVRKNTIGYDGWTRDEVLALPPLREDKLSDLLAKLHHDLYGTTYKANVVQLPIKPPPANKGSLDLSVSIGDLNNWVNKRNLKFAPIIGGASRTLSEVLSARKSGVFISNQRGLVIWSIPRNQNLAKYRAEARQFFLDSDLIVGAIANKYQLAIIARERVEPLLRLPPLRFETALMLAAERSPQLEQSYERDDLFAGKLRSGKDSGKDWAPIYLSDNLINTEFGSLLNITDQLLKSWSLNGKVKYDNFYYPEPLKWAPFSRSMEKIFNETHSVLFNWNTAGVGYTTSINSYYFFALKRTGALPITYGAKSELVKENQRIAYDYFSELGNSDLARVVQYTALYQIFHRFGITTEQATQGSLLPGTKVLESEATTSLEKLQALSPQELTQKMQMFALPIQEEKARSEKIANLRRVINEAKTRWKDAAIPELSRYLASPRTYNPVIRDPAFKTWLSSHRPLIDGAINVRRLLANILGTDIEKVKDHYVDALSKDSKTWIRTPSIVQSHTDFKVGGQNYVSVGGHNYVYVPVGGHNLDSRLTEFQSSPKVPIGKVVQIKEDGSRSSYNLNDVGKIPFNEDGARSVIFYHPNDVGKIPILKDGQKSLDKVLNLPTEHGTPTEPASRGLTESLEPPTSSQPLGWNQRNNPLTPEEERRLNVADNLGNNSIIVDRIPDGYKIYQSGNKNVVVAHTLPSFHEALNQSMRSISVDGHPTRIYLNGFIPQEAEALKLTAELRELKSQKIFLEKEYSFDENISLLNRQYEWHEATIKEKKSEIILDDPDYNYKETIEIEVPSAIRNQRPLHIQISILLKELSVQVREQFYAFIQGILYESASQELTFNQLVLQIELGLKKEFPHIHTEIHYDEKGDIIITDSVRQTLYKRRISYGY